MFWFALVTFWNALMSAESVSNPLRISIGVAKIGVNELLTALAFIWAVFQGATVHSRYPKLRTHPVLVWIFGLWIAAWICGSLGSIGSAITDKDLMTAMREYAAAPLYIFVGYRLLANFRSLRWLPYLAIAAGVGNAIALMLRFHQGAQELSTVSNNINALREIDYPTYYSVVAFSLLVYSVLSGMRIVRGWIALPLAGLCLVGALAAVSRTTAVCLVAQLFAIMLILPRGTRMKGALKLAVVLPALFLAFMIGVRAASSVTGKDFNRVVDKQIESLMPRDENSVSPNSGKAWDTRIPSIIAELGIFSKNPVTGQGFGGVADYLVHGGTNWGGFGHNSFTGIMAATGVIGLAAMLMTVLVPAIIGLRMVRDRFDHATMAVGALGYIIGVAVFLYGMCTMIFFIRTSMFFGLFCGMMIRAREIHETARAFAEQDSYEVDDNELPLITAHQTHDAVPGF